METVYYDELDFTEKDVDKNILGIFFNYPIPLELVIKSKEVSLIAKLNAYERNGVYDVACAVENKKGNVLYKCNLEVKSRNEANLVLAVIEGDLDSILTKWKPQYKRKSTLTRLKEVKSTSAF